MHRTPPQKVPPGPYPRIIKNVQHLGWSGSLSQSSHDESMNKILVKVGAFVTIHDENEIEFQEVLSRSSKKRKKNLPDQK